MGYTYQGPADHIQVDGTYYRPGDELPLSEEQVNALVRSGHKFEEFDQTVGVFAVPPADPVYPSQGPFDDRGQEIDLGPREKVGSRRGAKGAKPAAGQTAAAEAEAKD